MFGPVENTPFTLIIQSSKFKMNSMKLLSSGSKR